ncbi:cell wall-binding repeat-containing protein [Leucobacter sp. Ag1]|uniref:cell wall-binding repeat-containing protein n=1 Tax=Leucobacter sp. Ag1 TaxID=1642040 RepID=UPI00069A3CF0|nr:cell wall-binding repeat-containing protein [Leucobacter sp. Ag1]
MQNLNHTHSAGRAGQPTRWSRRLTAGATAVLLGANWLGFAGTAHAAPAGDAGKREAQSPTYVPGASIQPTKADTESEHYNTWHFGPGDGYAQRAVQQRNGVLLEAGVPTQVIRGNGNDVDQGTDSTPIEDVLDGLELVASDTADLSYQVGVRVDVNASGTWDDGDLWTTLRAPAGDPSVWTTSQAVGGLAAGAAAPAGEMLAALGDRAYAISTGFLAWKPAEPVLVSSFTDASGVTKFRPAPEATPTGEEKRESAPEIRPNGDTFPGWHDAADAGGDLSYEDMTGQWVPGGLNMLGKVQLIKGLEESAYLTNGIDRAQSMRVAATPKSPWEQSEDEDPAAPLWAQVLVRAYPDGVRDVPVDVIVRAAVPKNGDLSQASEWMLSAPVGGVPADTPVSFDEIRAALGEHDVTGYGVFLDTGDYAYLGQIVFNGTTTRFVQSSMPWIVNWSVKLSATTVKPGETITITGTGFDNGGEVLIAGLCRETVPVEATTSFTVTCTVPDDQQPGEVDLAVGYGSVKSRYFITIEAADSEQETRVVRWPHVARDGSDAPGWRGETGDDGSMRVWRGGQGFHWLMEGDSRLLNQLATDAYLPNAITDARTMRVNAWDESDVQGSDLPELGTDELLWAQIEVNTYPDGRGEPPVPVTVRALVPRSGEFSATTEWALSAAIGGIGADTAASIDTIAAALGEHDVIGYGVHVGDGASVLVRDITFGSEQTYFVTSPVMVFDPFVEVEPKQARPGDEVTIRMKHFNVDTSVRIAGLCTQAVRLNARGEASVTCTLPKEQEPGELRIIVTGDPVGSEGRADLTVLPADDPELTTPVDAVVPGKAFTFTGAGFAPGEAVTITGVCAQEVVADAKGRIAVECTVPDSHLPGVVTVKATGQKSDVAVSADLTIGLGPVDPPVAPVWSRLGGADRFETAVKVSREHFPNGAKAVVLSRHDVPADALTAAPFAVKQNAPLLLTQTGTLTAATKTELQRLKPDTVYIAGGTGAVSAQVEQQVRALGAKTVRMGGSDRYATANQIAKTGWGKTGASAVFIATGRDFPDALSAGAAAGGVDAPVLLVDGKAGAVRQDVRAQLTALKPAAVHIAGGTGVVSKGIESGLGKSAKVARHSGADRYATSAAIAKSWHTKSGAVYLATGAGFADALTGAAVAGGKPGPVLLVRSGCVPASVAGVLGEITPQAGYVLGGAGVVSERVLTNRNTCA